MKIFYTGAAQPGDKQVEPLKSLGGYIANTQVPNNLLSNVFPSISQLAIQKKRIEIRVLAIQNDSGVMYTGLTVYVDCPENPLSTYEIGFQVASLDSENCLTVEEVPSAQADPYTVELVKADGPGAKITLPDLDVGNYIGIYIKRYLTDLATTPKSSLQYETEFIDKTVAETDETIGLVFDWV